MLAFIIESINENAFYFWCCTLTPHVVSLSPFGNASYVIFGVYAINLGASLGGIILCGGWVFCFLGSDCCIGLSTFGGGLVLFLNGGTGWTIMFLKFTWYYVSNLFLI